MLQPLQLTNVSARYADEISVAGDFLQNAGCVLQTAGSLGAIVERLQRDRAFRRDLTSYIWVIVHHCDRAVSYADLLGVLAIAAAGTHFAAEANEDDAHALLRFVMEARESLSGVKKPENTSTPLDSPVSPPVIPPQPIRPETVSEHALLHSALPAELPLPEAEDTGGLRRRSIWIAVSVCAVAALSAGLVLHHRITPGETSPQAPAAPIAAVPRESKENTTPGPYRAAAPMKAEPSLSSSVTKRRFRAAFRARSSHEPPAKDASVLASPAAFPPRATPAIVATAPISASNISSTPTPAPAVKDVPAVASTVRPGSSSSTDSSAPDLSNTVRERQTPRLLRRTPEEQVELAESTRPADVATSPNKSNATINTPRGTVQAISLGTNAANVLYSPTPVYPLEASAAHVQGEVKLEANVDRAGNVSSVRVISGPPLLREAALDAAQRWRYRPNIAAGGPTPMNAITVFEFQLP